MEQKSQVKQLFSNYLRELYIEIRSEDLEEVKSICSKIQGNSWCLVEEDPDFMKSILSYFLVSRKCPEFKTLDTVSLIETRFDDEVKSTSGLIDYQGILILRHSSAFIRNKLIMETLLYIISERKYKNRSTIMVSNVAQDRGEYTYYDHNEIQKFLPAIGSSMENSRIHSSVTKIRRTASLRKSASRPLANINFSEEKTKDQKIKNRAKCIEEETKNAV